MKIVGYAGILIGALLGEAHAQAGLRWITEDKAIACIDRADRERLVQFAAQSDAKAYNRFLIEAVLREQCRLLDLGAQIFLEEKAPQDSLARLSKVRPKGSVTSYWIGDDDFGIAKP